MKRILMILILALTCMSFLSNLAEAKRFGGGGSFGKSRAIPTRQAQRTPDAAPAPSTPSGNRWMGPLAGLAIGAGLATMLSGGGLGGFGSGMSSILMILMLAGLAMFLFSKFRKSQQPNMQYAGINATNIPPQTTQGSNFKNGGTLGAIPPDFPAESFLRNAKMSFIRLQAANDAKDLNDIREYTTPEVFAEISMQIQERDNKPQKTDVIMINAELLEVVNEGIYSITSVLFTGELSENNGTPEKVDEIWYIQKSLQDINSPWLLAGIQQTNQT
jgi:predicted lipid-binding transport protein (Tim44 family)